MKPRITVLTLGVDDLERSLVFYRDGLGLATEGIVGGEFEYGAVAFVNLQNDLLLALWPRTSFARDVGAFSSTPECDRVHHRPQRRQQRRGGRRGGTGQTSRCEGREARWRHLLRGLRRVFPGS